MITAKRKAELAEYNKHFSSEPFEFFNAYGRLRIALSFELNITTKRTDRGCLWSHMSDWVEGQNFSEEQCDEIAGSHEKSVTIAMMLFLTFQK